MYFRNGFFLLLIPSLCSVDGMTPEDLAQINSTVARAANALARNIGKLPLYFAEKPITFRVPYTIHGELIIALTANNSAQFPEATFLHNVDKPFEIHRVIPRVTAIHEDVGPPIVNQVIYPQPVIGSGFERLCRLRIRDTSKNENLTKVGDTIETLTRADARVWELDDVYTLTRSEGLEIAVDILPFAPSAGVFLNTLTCAEGTGTEECISVDSLRIDITLEGALLVVAPPSEQR